MEMLAKGTRIEPTEELLQQAKRYAGCGGAVVGISRDRRCLRIKWDHLVDTQTIHPKFVRKAADGVE